MNSLWSSDLWKLEVTPNTNLFILSGDEGTCFEMAGETKEIPLVMQVIKEICEKQQEKQIDIN